MSLSSLVNDLAVRIATEFNAVRTESGAIPQHNIQWNGRYRLDSGEVNSFNSNYGPGYGNNGTDMGNHPLSFTTVPSNTQVGWMMPYRTKLETVRAWYSVNNIDAPYHILMWKQQKIVGSTAENNTLLWDSGLRTETDTRPQWLELGPADFGDIYIEEDELFAISLARPGTGSTRYFYVRAGIVKMIYSAP